MANREIVIDEIKYILGEYDWGVDVDIAEQCMSIEVEGVGTRTPSVRPKVDSARLQILQVRHSLKSWEYRGKDEQGKLLMDGEPLEINEEAVRSLPAKHGRRLVVVARDLNEMGEDEEKK